MNFELTTLKTHLLLTIAAAIIIPVVVSGQSNPDPSPSIYLTLERSHHVNDDDDNITEEFDRDDVYGGEDEPVTTSSEDDLATMSFGVTINDKYSGNVSVSGGGGLAFWEDAEKTTAADLSVGVIGPGEGVPGTESAGKTVYVEGLSNSGTVDDVKIVASYSGDGDGSDDEDDLGVDDIVLYTTVYQVNLDIDSNNDGTVGGDLDDKIENSQKNQADVDPEGEEEKVVLRPGKFVFSNQGDKDGDEVPDFADFDGTTNNAFVPLDLDIKSPTNMETAKISFDYIGSDPADQSLRSGGGSYEDPFIYTQPSERGAIRIWLKDATASRDVRDIKEGGDYITPGVVYDLSMDLFSSSMTLYMEGVSSVSGVDTVTVTVLHSIPSDGTDSEEGEGSGEETNTYSVEDIVRYTLLKVDIEEVWSNQFAGIEVNKLPGQSGFQGRGYLVNGGEEYLLIGSASDGSTSFKVKFNMPNIPEIHDLVKFTLLNNGSVSLPLLDPVHTDIDWSSKIATVDFNIDEYTNDYDGFSVLMYLDLNSNNYFDASEPVLVDSILSNGSSFHLKFVDPARYFSAQVLGVGGAIYGGTLGGTPDAASYLATFSTGNAPSGAVALNANLSIADDHPDHNVGVVFNNSGVGSVENYVFGSQSDFSFRVLDSASMADLLRLVIGSHYLEIADAFSTTPMEDRLIGGNLSFTFQIDDFRNHIVFDSSDENIQFALGTAGIIGSVEVIVSEFDGAFFSEAVAVDGNVIDMYDWDYDGNLGAYDDDFAALQTGYNTLGEGGHIFKSRIRVEGSIPGFTFQITPNPNNPF